MHYSTEIIVEIKNKNEEIVPIRCLLDTGTSSTILLKPFVNAAKSHKQPKATMWRTLGGTFQTRKKSFFEFKLPEFSVNKMITWVVHVDDQSDPSTAQYNMIIGTDLLEKMGLDISFKDKTMTWDEITIPMKERGFVSQREVAEAIYSIATDPPY